MHVKGLGVTVRIVDTAAVFLEMTLPQACGSAVRVLLSVIYLLVRRVCTYLLRPVVTVGPPQALEFSVLCSVPWPLVCV